MTDKQIVEGAIFRGYETAWMDAGLDVPKGDAVVAAVMEELGHSEVQLSLKMWLHMLDKGK